jgi:hypothetical protein
MNLSENMELSIPGFISFIWALLLVLRRPEIPGRLNLAASIVQGLGCLMWFGITAVVWLCPGGHPPAAGLAAILGVVISMPLYALSLLLAIIACFIAEKRVYQHFDPIIYAIAMLVPVVYAALYIR